MSVRSRCAMLAIAVLATLACNEVDAEKRATFDDPALFAEATDAWAVAELGKGTDDEARDWLAQPGHRLFEGEPAAAERLVEGLYERGATSVRFTGIQKVDDAFVSAAIAVELPQDPDARASLLAYEAHVEGRDEPLPDLGQRYLGFSFD